MKKYFAFLAIVLLLVSFVTAPEPELIDSAPELYEEETEAGVTPDSFLYGLDRAMERISLALTFNKAKKAEKGLKHAQERLMEVKQMIEENKLDKAEKAQEAHGKSFEMAEKAAEDVEDEEEKEQIKNMIQSHYEKVVQVKTTILERQRDRMSEEQIAKLEEVFGKIMTKAKEMETKIEQEKEEVGKPEETEEDETGKPEDKGEEGKSEDAGEEGKGKLELLVSDAPADIGDFEYLIVEFSKTRIFMGGKPVEKSIEGKSADLTELVGEKAFEILSTELDAGTYNKIELYVESVDAKVGNETVEVKVPSGKLMMTKNFEVVADETTTFVFDINVVKKGQGDYNLLPVISKSGVVGKDLDEHDVDEVEEEEEEEAECTTDEDCEEGYTCVEEECEEVEEEPECTLDEDCEEGYTCVEEVCVEVTPECVEDLDCSGNYTCVEGECVEATV